MKKIKLISIILISSLFIMSCQKDKFLTENIEMSNSNSTILSSLRHSNQDIEKVINLSYNIQDKQNREIQNLFGTALTKILFKKEYVKLIIDDAKNSPLKEANLNRVSKANNSFLRDLNKELSKLKKGASLSSLKTQLLYEQETYEPVIVIPNLDKARYDILPIVSSGLDVIEETVDDIVANFILEDGSYKEVLLNENEAISVSKPILIFGLGIDDSEFIGKNVLLDENQYYNYSELKPDSNFYKNSTSSRGVSRKNFSNIHTSIKNKAYFYEGNGKNEYTQKTYPWLNLNKWGYEKFGTSGSTINTIKRFTKNECNGSQFTTWDHLCKFSTNYYAPNTPSDIFNYRTYERDWQTPQKYAKSLTSMSYKGKTLYPTVRMRYSNEWYINYTWTYNDDQMPLWKYKDIQSYKSKAAFMRTK